MTLAQVADELYALAPAEFRAARDERAAQARQAGDAGLADAIKKLRRPTVSAWLVNLLARADRDQVDELLALGESLHAAQRALDGDRLRDLSAQRSRLVTEIFQEAKRLASQAGQPVSAQVEREVRDTLEAALVDPASADAVRSGQLASSLSYAGLGEGIGVGDDGAAWPTSAERPFRPDAQAAPSPARERGKRAAPAGSDRRTATAAERERREAEAAERTRRAAEAAERELREADAGAHEAQADLDQAEREVTSALGQHEALERRIAELERQLDETHAELTQSGRALRQARRSRDTAARVHSAALRRLERARARAG
jgi:DNA repair exonuclease SbcCD ATPase subunit